MKINFPILSCIYTGGILCATIYICSAYSVEKFY